MPNRTRAVLRLDGCEPRVLPAVAGPVAVVVGVAHPAALGDKVAACLAAAVGTRVGGGECAQAVTEALRAAGANFTPTRTPDGGYAWGTPVTTGRFRPGDVVQLAGAAFAGGRHTAVVATVDAAGHILTVYEQNAGSRVVRRGGLPPAGGRAAVTVYRPAARVPTPGRVEFTVVNTVAKPVTVRVAAGATVVMTVTLSAAGTAASYRTAWVTATGPVTLAAGGGLVVARDGAGYAVTAVGVTRLAA